MGSGYLPRLTATKTFCKNNSITSKLDYNMYTPVTTRIESNKYFTINRYAFFKFTMS